VSRSPELVLKTSTPVGCEAYDLARSTATAAYRALTRWMCGVRDAVIAMLPRATRCAW
jgi:hypothetical protein